MSDKKDWSKLKKAIEDWDLLLRPLIIVCNSDNEEQLKECLGNGYVYVSNPLVNKSTIFIMERSKLNEDFKLITEDKNKVIEKGVIKGYFGNEKYGFDNWKTVCLEDK